MPRQGVVVVGAVVDPRAIDLPRIRPASSAPSGAGRRWPGRAEARRRSGRDAGPAAPEQLQIRDAGSVAELPWRRGPSATAVVRSGTAVVRRSLIVDLRQSLGYRPCRAGRRSSVRIGAAISLSTASGREGVEDRPAPSAGRGERGRRGGRNRWSAMRSRSGWARSVGPVLALQLDPQLGRYLDPRKRGGSWRIRRCCSEDTQRRRAEVWPDLEAVTRTSELSKGHRLMQATCRDAAPNEARLDRRRPPGALGLPWRAARRR